MTLRVPDKWLWDFWTVEHDGRLHVFFLQAPTSLGDPDLRHWNVTIGHAVTDDLHGWELLPDALAPSPQAAFDDRSTWTGSIVRHDGTWHMLYTGTSHADDGLVQRIGLATSRDLVTWERHGPPVLEADARWYELLDRDAWFDQAWRDPWVFRGPDDRWHAYVTARARAGAARGRAVVGHAVSDDLVAWDVLPPVTAPMGFGQMEVPQLIAWDDRWFLLFGSDPGTRLPDAAPHPGTGTWALSAASPLGPFAAATLHVLEADETNAPYAGKIVPFGGRQHFLGWEGAVDGGPFRGVLCEPRSVRRDGDLLVVGHEE